MYDENFYCQYNEANEVFEIVKDERVYLKLHKEFVENLHSLISQDKVTEYPILALVVNHISSFD